MPLAKETTGLSRFITFASFVLVVTVLRVAQDVMIPVALSLLLAFLLSPLVVRLTRWKVPKTLAIILTASLAFVVIGLTAWQITTQAMSLLNELPKYEDNVTAKIAALKKPDSTGSLSRALTTLERFWLSVQAPDPTTSAPVTPDGTKPVPVEVKPSHATGIDFVREVAGRLFEPLGVAGIVIVLVIATLFQREDLRSRFIRVVSGGQINIATEAVDDASRRVSRYLFAQLMVNTFFGVAVGLGLFFIGVPHAGLWGLLSTLLRFIPFLGPLIAVVFPLALSIAVDPGWTMLFWTAGLFIVAELLTNNVIEVLVYGTSTGISTLALLAAAVFWSWLWGLPGLFLSTPMTVCLLVLGQYVPGLRFLGVLLGSEPPLEPSAQFYQTMLSMDQEDLFAQAEAHVQQRTLAGFYDDVFVPALLMSEVDRHKGLLAEVRQRFIFDAGQELIEELSERERAVPLSPPGSAPLPPRFRDQVLIGVPARDEADELVGLMLAHLLRESGLRAKVSGVTASADSYARELKSEDATVFVSGLPPATLSAAGRACRRVKEMNPAAKVIVGIWAADQQTKNLHHRLEQAGADRIVTRLADAVEQLKAMLIVAPAPNAPQPETQTTRVLEQTERVVASARPEEATDAVVKELARALDVPVSLVTIVESDQVFWKEVGIVASDLRAGEKTVFDEAIATDHFQAVGEMAKDERFAQHPLLAKRGVQAFASAPLRTRAGHRVGNLCVLDTKPRAFSEADKELLQSLAVQLMEAIDGKPTVDEGAAVNEAAP
ncbi:MAG TPA: AI-2E family transporter [Opitutus sp.]|nr:AI-2E family transporter [Opitutus sp.]